VLNYEFKIIPDSEKFIIDELNGQKIVRYRDLSEIEFEKFPTLKVVGIVTPVDESASKNELGSIGYMPSLMDKMIDFSNQSDVVSLQSSTTTHNLFNGRPFGGYMPYLGSIDEVGTIKYTINQYSPQLLQYLSTDRQIMSAFQSYLSADKKFSELLATAPWGGFGASDITTIIDALTRIATNPNYEAMTQAIAGLCLNEAKTNRANFLKLINELLPSGDHAEAMSFFGHVDKSSPKKILIYPKDFEAKETINKEITAYNEAQPKEDQITYSDTIGFLLSSVTTIVNAITYVLVAFVAISLVVSSIMIGIITYISVLERTKEIGILRAIGASKKDVSRVFNAETLIIGFTAGAIGILVTLFFNWIINIILGALTGLETLKATLSPVSAIVLVLISMGLTLIAGLVPSKIAAKKDPVIALRSE
jgi:putative ABC transport system permease protein